VRATLLESNPGIALVLPRVCDALGIPLTVVGTVDAVRRATRRATSDDVISVDCSLDRPEEWARCLAVVRQTSLDVHIIYDPAAPDDTIDRSARARATQGALTWLSAPAGMIAFLTLLRGWRDQALQARALAAATAAHGPSTACVGASRRGPLAHRDRACDGQQHRRGQAGRGAHQGQARRRHDRATQDRLPLGGRPMTVRA